MDKISRLRRVGIGERESRIIGGGEPGEVKFGFWDTSQPAPEGWLWLNGDSIGNVGSSATHQGAIYEELFTHLWNTIDQAYCNVRIGLGIGRGASAQADWKAGARIALPDSRQKMPLCQAASGTGSALGSSDGAIDHRHSTPAHYHGMGTGADLNITSSGGHSHGVYTKNQLGGTSDSMGFAAKGADGASGCVAATTSTDGSHTHAKTSFSGSIGLVTGGVNGNAAMTSGTNNPPYLVYVAKIAY